MESQIPTPPTQPETPARHFLNKKFLITIVVLILLGGGAYAGMNYWQRSSVNVPVATFTPRPDATANWKTYTNTQYGFSFKYPADWLLQDGKDIGVDADLFHSVLISNKLSGNEYQRVDFTSSAEDLLGNQVPDKKVSFAGAEWNAFQFNDGSPGQDASHDSESYITKKGSVYFSIVLYPVNGKINSHDGTLDPLLNQILSTFKFIDAATSSKSVSGILGPIGGTIGSGGLMLQVPPKVLGSNYKFTLKSLSQNELPSTFPEPSIVYAAATITAEPIGKEIMGPVSDSATITITLQMEAAAGTKLLVLVPTLGGKDWRDGDQIVKINDDNKTVTFKADDAGTFILIKYNY